MTSRRLRRIGGRGDGCPQEGIRGHVAASGGFVGRAPCSARYPTTTPQPGCPRRRRAGTVRGVGLWHPAPDSERRAPRRAHWTGWRGPGLAPTPRRHRPGPVQKRAMRVAGGHHGARRDLGAIVEPDTAGPPIADQDLANGAPRPDGTARCTKPVGECLAEPLHPPTGRTTPTR